MFFVVSVQLDLSCVSVDYC